MNCKLTTLDYIHEFPNTLNEQIYRINSPQLLTYLFRGGA